MIVDSHMHVWSMDDVDYYDDKTIYQYMQENAIDKTAIIAISEKENAEMKWYRMNRISFSGLVM